MDFLQILVLALYITHVFTKSRSRKYKALDSDEGSIENLLYYKDCQRSAKTEPPHEVESMRQEMPSTLPPPPPPKQPECPFPKMCCALTCGNECGGGQPTISRMQSVPPNNIQQSQPMQFSTNVNPPGLEAVQPQMIQRRKKKTRLQPNNMQTLIPTRRDYSGFTKEKIKGLIAQDGDIRKILKDLVRVTMQKVDLQDMINSNRNNRYDDVNTVRSVPTTVLYDMDDYVE